MRRKLLVVDDDVHIRRLIQLFLRNSEYDVTDRGTGEEALQLTEQFDVILVDVILPFFGGYRLAQKLRSATPSARIVAMSGDESQREAAASYGVDAFLAKPFSAEQLREALAAPRP